MEPRDDKQQTARHGPAEKQEERPPGARGWGWNGWRSG